MTDLVEAVAVVVAHKISMQTGEVDAEKILSDFARLSSFASLCEDIAQAAIAAHSAHIREQAGRDGVQKQLLSAANQAWTKACEDEALGSNAAMTMVVDAVVTAMLNQIGGSND
jgi:hypothetical protein